MSEEQVAAKGTCEQLDDDWFKLISWTFSHGIPLVVRESDTVLVEYKNGRGGERLIARDVAWSQVEKFMVLAPGVVVEPTAATNEKRKHAHYFKDVRHLDTIDIYRVLMLFGVTDPCLQHAAKKILPAGGRGHKDMIKDVREAVDSLQRCVEMWQEDEKVG